MGVIYELFVKIFIILINHRFSCHIKMILYNIRLLEIVVISFLSLGIPIIFLCILMYYLKKSDRILPDKQKKKKKPLVYMTGPLLLFDILIQLLTSPLSTLWKYSKRTFKDDENKKKKRRSKKSSNKRKRGKRGKKSKRKTKRTNDKWQKQDDKSSIEYDTLTNEEQKEKEESSPRRGSQCYVDLTMLPNGQKTQQNFVNFNTFPNIVRRVLNFSSVIYAFIMSVYIASCSDITTNFTSEKVIS
ncbi:uncharacterized protein LOC111630285 [Centruroides sculpturatus]|uniref:uncharacterized protein LOC111630285 n=1 Tax=Centruroides sculpturatus TaxID=218467 RepID=UPI000C6DE8F7|nr:uncharacterized protein LOC111630285 [Centruroides sculpturatus]